ncbi:MAG: glycerol-3-phosphate dehydrogenase/oxidase [Paracoccaceae bacterium]
MIDTVGPNDDDFDVIILGAGINGAGTFRDLCLQGLKCLIVDKSDFGSGTSAAPSRLIHGGLKYLETGEFRLVAESTRERNLLLKNAPHVVKPLSTVIPVRSWFSGIWAAINTFIGRKVPFRSRGLVLIALGLWLYDRFGRQYSSMPKRKFFSKEKALKLLPSMTSDIVGFGSYYDAKITEPERLIWELIEDGLAASPSSRALNYCPVIGVKKGSLQFKPEGSDSFSASARFVVNAAGPWIDQVNQALGLETTFIGGTKGSHMVLDDPELVSELDGQMVYFEGQDGRILLIFENHGKLLVGSSDIPAEDPDDLICTDEEVDYFLDGLRSLFPARAFRRDQIIYTYAGLRPLPNSEGVEPGLISRDHSAPIIETVPERPFPIMSLIGGKWTTFRAFAEDVSDQILDRLETPRRQSTVLCPIGGGANFPVNPPDFNEVVADFTKSYGISSQCITNWLARYGPRKTKSICESGLERLDERDIGTGYTGQEIAWLAQNECVVHAEDILFRRTQLAVTGQVGSALDTVIDILGTAFDWPSEKKSAERQRSLQVLARHSADAQKAPFDAHSSKPP